MRVFCNNNRGHRLLGERSRRRGSGEGFSLVELAIALGILVIVAGVVLFNLGTFFAPGNVQAVQAREAEQYKVVSAVTMYQFDGNTIAQSFTVGPDDKNVLRSYIVDKLQYCWAIGADGRVHTGNGCSFSSDLTSLAGFASLMGNWTASGGVLSPSVEQYQNRVVTTGGPWEDFTFQATAALISGDGYGIYYRCDSNPNITGYIFQVDPGLGNKFVVRKVVTGFESDPFQQVKMPPGFRVNGQHNILVSVQGDHHVISIDGSMVLNFRDSQYMSGTVGLRSWNNSRVNFTQFKVSPQ